jgi:hypothetical protein
MARTAAYSHKQTHGARQQRQRFGTTMALAEAAHSINVGHLGMQLYPDLNVR